VCRLSIIIPLWADNDSFEDTLASVLQNRPAECEVIVVHSQVYDDPYDLAGEVRFVPVPQDAGSSQMINAGCRASQGDIVHVLQPGVLATDGWTDSALASFRDLQVCAVAPILVDAADEDRIMAAGLRYARGGRRVCHAAGAARSEDSRVLLREIVGPGLFAGFYRRWIWEAIGGFCERLDVDWADVDFALSLQALGYRAVLAADSVVRTSSTAVPDVPLSFRSGRGAECVFWRHAAVNGLAASLVCHPFTVFASLLRDGKRGAAYAHFGGRICALFGIGGHLAHAGRVRRDVEFFLLETPPAALNSGRRQDPQGPSAKSSRQTYRDAA